MQSDYITRFWQKVDKSGDCWEWTGATARGGYGYFRIHGRVIGAHRVAWTLFVGPIPEGMVICHKCDNRKCVRVSHLFVGTQRENLADARAKGRMPSPPKYYGERHGRARLTTEKVRMMRQMARDGVPYTDIGRTYGVSPHCARSAVVGETWGWVK